MFNLNKQISDLNTLKSYHFDQNEIVQSKNV